MTHPPVQGQKAAQRGCLVRNISAMDGVLSGITLEKSCGAANKKNKGNSGILHLKIKTGFLVYRINLEKVNF